MGKSMHEALTRASLEADSAFVQVSLEQKKDRPKVRNLVKGWQNKSTLGNCGQLYVGDPDKDHPVAVTTRDGILIWGNDSNQARQIAKTLAENIP